MKFPNKLFNFKLTPSGELQILQRGTRENFLYNGTFHEAIGPILAFAQLFGVMPLCGVKSKTPQKLRLTWSSLRLYYSTFVILSLLGNTMLVIWWTFHHRLEFGKMIPLVFNVTNLMSLVAFFVLATKWHELMLKWETTEKFLPPLRNQFEKQKLAYQMKMISIIILTVSLIEHLLSIVVGVHDANNCPAIRDPIRAYFINNLPAMFYVFNYRGPLAVYGKFVNVTATFTWSFTDLFVILVAVGLTSRFRQLNEILVSNKGKDMPIQYWIEHRMYYRKLCCLVVTADKAIAGITMLSISNNLFFICVQLLNSLNKMPTFAHSFYFWFSLLYLIVRTLAVSLYSASINDESKKPSEVFRAVPREAWNLEIKRFTEEVANDVVALSGMNFFYMTRKLMLSVAGTIITYELVLIQFHQDDNLSDFDPCMAKNATAMGLIFG